MLRMDPEKRAVCEEVVDKFRKIHDTALVDENYCLRPPVSNQLKRVSSNLSVLEPHLFETITPYLPCNSMDDTIEYQDPQFRSPCTSNLSSGPWRPPEKACLHTNSSGKFPHRSSPSRIISKRVHFTEQSAPTAYIDETDAVSGYSRVPSTTRQDNAGGLQPVSMLSTSGLKHSSGNSGGDKLKSQVTICEKLRRLWPRRKD